jgi:hypothetical protein
VLRCGIRRLAVALLLGALVSPGARLQAAQALDSNLLVFPSVQGSQHFGTGESGLHGEGTADFLYTLIRGPLRFLGEAEFSTEHAELDRLQLGWRLSSDSYIWLGKFHEPSSSWNFERDHGQYLQTAISTPAIETPGSDRWGEGSGVVPENVTGILLDSTRPLSESAAVQFSLGLGIVPNPEYGNAAYWTDPISSGRHHVGWTARLTFLPDHPRNGGIGLLASRYRLDTSELEEEGSLDARSIDQETYGIYDDSDWGPWSLHATFYRIDFRLRESEHPRTQHINAAYVQLERRLAASFTAYTRVENASNVSEAEYIRALHDHFESRRLLAGWRWDFARHQACTAELAHGWSSAGRMYTIRLQWSAVIQ